MMRGAQSPRPRRMVAAWGSSGWRLSRERPESGGVIGDEASVMILAGDIGGTKTILALFDAPGRTVAERIYPSRDHAGLGEIAFRFLSETGLTARRACFGVAGPVKNGICRTTNLPWIVDAAQLAADLGIRSVELINDLEATGHGIPSLAEADLVTLNEGAPDAVGNAALIAAGTGLGEAGLYWDGREHRAFASEGGHAGFGPRDDLEIELLRYLLGRFGAVSWERVVSGPGLHHIYLFLRDSGRGEEPPWLADRLRLEDPPEVISKAALEGSSPLCVGALDRFVSLYGAEAGNLALKVMATGGVFVAGGVAPKILPKMKEPRFLEAFFSKGPMRPLLEAIPVRVILNEKTALIGAARYAARSSGGPEAGGPSTLEGPR